MPSRPSELPATGDAHPVLIRIGEIFLKGRNRRVFIRQLMRNIKRALAGMDDVWVENLYLRPVVWHPEGARREVLRRLSRVFGIQSLSPAVTVERSLDSMKETAVELARSWPRDETFKVETNRRDKSFGHDSMKVSYEVGGAIHTELGIPVDVRRPQRTLNVEIGVERSFLFSDWAPGPGGLPVGSAGNLTLLLSGGIDSPVAGWSAMRRGCNLHAVYFHSFPYTGDKTKEKVLDLARILARWQGRLAVHVVHFTDVQKKLRSHKRADLVVLMYRRMMVRVAEALGRQEDTRGLVTGENIAQVASQTLENLGVVQAATTLPVIRPLVTLDKTEIVDQARSIGTYDKSIEPYEDSCSLFVPKNPATKARPRDLDNAEKDFDIDAMVEELSRSAERIVVE